MIQLTENNKIKDLDEKLNKILKETFQNDKINLEYSMDEIPEWDSLKNIQLIIALEEEFNIAIDFSDTLEMTSIPSIKNKILKYLK